MNAKHYRWGKIKIKCKKQHPPQRLINELIKKREISESSWIFLFRFYFRLILFFSTFARVQFLGKRKGWICFSKNGSCSETVFIPILNLVTKNISNFWCWNFKIGLVFCHLYSPWNWFLLHRCDCVFHTEHFYITMNCTVVNLNLILKYKILKIPVSSFSYDRLFICSHLISLHNHKSFLY